VRLCRLHGDDADWSKFWMDVMVQLMRVGAKFDRSTTAGVLLLHHRARECPCPATLLACLAGGMAVLLCRPASGTLLSGMPCWWNG
jgi:hypothetical protein